MLFHQGRDGLGGTGSTADRADAGAGRAWGKGASPLRECKPRLGFLFREQGVWATFIM